MSRPAETNRDKLYAALKDAGEAGLMDPAFHAVVPLAGMHLSSLIAEGHGVESFTRETPLGPRCGVRLTKDAWA